MSLHIIIDGYNLIRQSGFLDNLDRRNIQSGRDALVEMLSAYRRIKHHDITVVFDGSKAPLDCPNRDRVQGVRIEYSRYGELADTVIKRMANRERERAIVVSSDRDVIRCSAASGCATLSSPEFERKLLTVCQMADTEPDIESNAGWIPTTRKKGPSRRLSKSKRRNRVKTEKL